MDRISMVLIFLIVLSTFSATDAQESEQKTDSLVNDLIVIGIHAEQQTVQFGDPLKIIVELKNRGEADLFLKPDSLILQTKHLTELVHTEKPKTTCQYSSRFIRNPFLP